MFNVSLNEIAISEPLGLDELNERLYLDTTFDIYLYKLDGDVRFIGDGYNTLRQIFNADLCATIDVEIHDTRTDVTYTGVIFINDIEWNLSKRIASVKIVADRYIQFIDNNKGIKVQIGVAKAKNFLSINSVAQTDITLPDPTGTTHITRTGYRVLDVLNELVEFMSDGELTVESDYFDPANGGNAAYSVIMTGYEVRMRDHVDFDPQTPLLTFQDFWKDINKLHNIAGVVIGNVLKVEPKSYFRQQGISTTLENVNEVSQEINTEMLYSHIKMGSAQVSESIAYLIRLSFNGFQQEQFYIQGQCNTYNELDLQCHTLITDTNIIQEIQPVANGGTDLDDYDDDIVIIHCNSTNTAFATVSPLSSDYYYNEFFTNMRVSERWNGEYPFSIIQQLETDNLLVQATLTNDSVNVYLDCDNDTTPPNFDTGGDYQVGSMLVTPVYTATAGYFEAPSDMVVIVNIDMHITGAYTRSVIHHVDALGVVQTPQTEIDFILPMFTYVNNRHVVGSATLYMEAGTRVYCKVEIETIHAGATFKVAQLGTYGGIYSVVNSEDTFISKVDVEFPTPVDQWETIKAAKYKSIEGTFVDGGFKGFLLDGTRNIMTGASKIRTYQRRTDIDG